MKIGVDGGGSKTELILVDDTGQVVRRHLAAGSNPNVIGAESARRVLDEALAALTDGYDRHTLTHTLLCMAGSRVVWRETAAGLTGFGQVFTTDDALPVLELATGGAPGLVLHGGTGSFVAARTAAHRDPLTCLYAGGLGWRFGDPGSGYDLGRRAVARGLLELQGWLPASRLGPSLQAHTGLTEVGAITRCFYGHADPNRLIGTLAPTVLSLASEGDGAARELVAASTGELLDLALNVATQAFPNVSFDTLRAGLSGPVLTHPVVVADLTPRSPLPLIPVTRPPIEGVRALLGRLPS